MNAETLKKFIARRHPVYLVIAIGLCVLAAGLHLNLRPLQAEYFPVRFVRIQGALRYLEKSELEASIRPQLESGYWDVDLERIRSDAAQIPWVRAVQIQRIWPDTLILRIEEHVPFARFGEGRLLSTRGLVYSPGNNRRFSSLPLIEGPVEQSVQLFTAFREMQECARDQGLTLEKLQVTGREAWAVRSSDGLTVELGRAAPIKTFRRFIASLSLLGDQQIRSMVRADLRYRNGYAVEWEPGSKPEWGSFVKRNDPGQGEAVQSI